MYLPGTSSARVLLRAAPPSPPLTAILVNSVFLTGFMVLALFGFIESGRALASAAHAILHQLRAVSSDSFFCCHYHAARVRLLST